MILRYKMQIWMGNLYLTENKQIWKVVWQKITILYVIYVCYGIVWIWTFINWWLTKYHFFLQNYQNIHIFKKIILFKVKFERDRPRFLPCKISWSGHVRNLLFYFYQLLSFHYCDCTTIEYSTGNDINNLLGDVECW